MISKNTNLQDTIVAISTPLGAGAISIVRLSGKNALHIAKALSHKDDFIPRYATLSDIYDKDGVMIDESLIIYFKAPKSYTAEDLCEIHCHGGILVAREIISSSIYYGARAALPGEFTKRAFLNNRIDLSQAQAISKLIQSTSLKANQMLLSQLKGDLGRYINKTQENLLELLAYSEASIDYAEDLESDLTEQMTQKLCSIKQDLEKIYGDSTMRQNLIEGHRLAIIGRPNVGKSSILNALLNYDRAIISEIEGTTRDTIEECITIQGEMIRIIDTAGIRQGEGDIEQIGIQRSYQAFEQSDIILCVFDSSLPLESKDEQILNLLDTSKDKHIIIALNKNDKKQVIDKERFAKYEVIEINHKDIDNLKKALNSFIAQEDASSGVILISEYQLSCVKSSIEHISKAIEVLKSETLELFSYHLVDASKSLGAITKAYDNESVLDKMFSSFCLGK